MVRAAQTGSSRPLAVTMGEPGGIGLDIALMVWEQRATLGCPAFYLRADPDAVARRASRLGRAIPLAAIAPSEANACFAEALPVAVLQAPVSDGCGVTNKDDATAILESISVCVDDVQAGRAAAIVTNPINKKSLYDAGFDHPGHTEYLAALCAGGDNTPEPVMMLAGPRLRAVPLTVHVPLKDVPRLLTTELIVRKALIVANELQDRFAISAPRLAFAGLNPHAGEGGQMGTEDAAIIAPAIAKLTALGIDASGPLPADTMFHPAARASYDVALCMYHDQALIPAKALDFAETVNVTLGLPFVRTSPDHGTALALAGTGRADPSSLAAALRLARSLAAAQPS
ncbi:MAG: 4-hydroxythreonine-4-phosphate dehydrogenase PdxA [Alphaproteobacteria bacterium]